MFDPQAGGEGAANVGLPIYESWRSTIDWIYFLSAYLMQPVNFLYSCLAPFLPKLNWFPGVYSASILQFMNTMAASQPSLQKMAESPFLQKALVGYIDYLVLVAIIVYSILNPLIDRLYEWLKNMLWVVLIEFSFTKKKEAKYQEALEKRAADLMKLNVEYKNLSKEASMLAHSVITDELTKVYNKRFFLNKIASEFQTSRDKKQILAIAMLDIDHFKKLNDTYGHLMGDKVLQAVAQVAKRNTPGDCFCCRFGGEEFSIIMPGKTTAQAMDIVSTIHRSLPLLRFEEDPELRTSASFGMCVADFKLPSTQEIGTFEDFIKLADDELYRAKLNGRNRVECNTLQ